MTEKSQVADIDRSIYDIRDAEHDAYRMEAGLTPAIVEKLSKEKNDPAFARQLAELGDLYVNDAFSAAHRAHASTEGLARLLPAYAGCAMARELSALDAALGNPQSEADGMWGASSDVRQMTEYYAYFFQYWLEQTDYSIDGFRCDFAQGLPPQAWEYLVNKAKSLKPELAFMAESLDGGAVSKRAGRQFDIINDSWVWGMLNGSPNVTAIRSEIDSRKAAYGFAGVMRGLINHDQSAPANKWWTLSRYAIGCAIDAR